MRIFLSISGEKASKHLKSLETVNILLRIAKVMFLAWVVKAKKIF